MDKRKHRLAKNRNMLNQNFRQPGQEDRLSDIPVSPSCHSRETFWWQFFFHIAAVVVILVTALSIWADRDNILSYYSERHDSTSQNALSFADAFDGSGTEDDPYQICSPLDFSLLRNMIGYGVPTSGVYFAQQNDIDLSGTLWLPLATEKYPFYGVYDGCGYRISNMTFSFDNNSFMGILRGTVRNLQFTNTTLGGNNNAVIANGSASNRSYSIINCIVSGIFVPEDVQYESLASIANDISGFSVIGCYTINIPDLVCFSNNATLETKVLDCIHSDEIIDSCIQQGNISYSSLSLAECESIGNETIQALGQYDIKGYFNTLLIEDGELCFDTNRVYIYQENALNNFWAFMIMVLIYLLITALIIVLSILISRNWRLNHAKCIVYMLFGTFAAILLVAGILTRGSWIISMLYDGYYNGQLKYFTDFSDCLLPGLDPYTRNGTYYTSIYPPFISMVFGILQRLIPGAEMANTITVRNSQMGNMVFLFWTGFWLIIFYEIVLAYKKGHKAERILFFILMCSTYPFIHCMERGNVVFVAALLIAVFLFNYKSESFWKRQLAFLSLSTAAGIKIYPAFLGILLIKEKRFKDVLNCLSMGIVVNLLPSVFFKTGFSSIAYMLINATAYVESNSLIGGKIDLSHLLQLPGELLNLSENADPMQFYSQIVMVIGILTLIVVFFSRLEDWKIYMLCIMALILLASFSPYYYFLYAIAPLMMFVDSKPKNHWLTTVYGVLFAGIFMTFVTNIKYPVYAFAPTQSVWHMTLVSGTFAVLFEIVLLTDGLISCVKRIGHCLRSRNEQ